MALQLPHRPPPREGMRADYAYNHVKRLILDGQTKAGDRLDVNALVGQLGFSRQPVIQALNRLSAEGFVEVVPQVGCWVAGSDPADIADFFRLLATTEGLAAEFAAERVTPAGLAELAAIDRKIAALLDGAGSGEDIGHAYRMLNRAFHGQVHAMAESEVVHAAASGMWDRCDFYLNTHGRNILADRATTSHEEHAGIMKALCKGDPRRARKAMQLHVLQFGTAVTALIRDAPGDTPGDAPGDTAETEASATMADRAAAPKRTAPGRARKRA